MPMLDHRGILKRWLDGTQRVLAKEARRMKVEDTEALQGSIGTQLSEAGDGNIRGRLLFLTRGRFVDMGAGRASRLHGLDRRRAKKWYSPAFYGRLSDLRGALGLELMEHTMGMIKSLEDGGK